MRRFTITVGIGALLVAGVAAGVVATSMAGASGEFAKATLRDSNNVNVGWVSFEQGDERTEVRVHLTAAPGIDAFHGFHIHANNNAANGSGCVADSDRPDSDRIFICLELTALALDQELSPPR